MPGSQGGVRHLPCATIRTPEQEETHLLQKKMKIQNEGKATLHVELGAVPHTWR